VVVAVEVITLVLLVSVTLVSVLEVSVLDFVDEIELVLRTCCQHPIPAHLV
jgi:hypothetical protein